VIGGCQRHDRPMMTKKNSAIPRPPKPMSLAIHRSLIIFREVRVCSLSPSDDDGGAENSEHRDAK
jgi:hypothetical protein